MTPYWPIGDENVQKFFEDCGFEVVAIKGLKCESPAMIAQVTEEELRNNAFGVVCGRPNERILKIDVARTADGGSAPPTHTSIAKEKAAGVFALPPLICQN